MCVTPSFSFSGLENRITKKTHFWQSFLGHPTRSVYTVLIFIDLVMVLRIKTQSNRRQPLWIFANVLCYIRCMLLMILFDRFRLSSLLYFFVFSFCFIFFSFLFFFFPKDVSSVIWGIILTTSSLFLEITKCCFALTADHQRSMVFLPSFSFTDIHIHVS